MTAGKSSAPVARALGHAHGLHSPVHRHRATEFPAICDLLPRARRTPDGTARYSRRSGRFGGPRSIVLPDAFPAGGRSVPVRDRRPRPHLETHRERAPAEGPGGHVRDLARPAAARGDRRRPGRGRGSARAARLGRRALRPCPAGQRGRGPRARRRRPGARGRRGAARRGGAEARRGRRRRPRHAPRTTPRRPTTPASTRSTPSSSSSSATRNRFAHAAALAVAELPGQAYNPLFIYGPPGVGKTHLLHSIGNYVRATGDGLSVRYTTVETFTNEFIAAINARLDRPLQGPLPPQRRPPHRRRAVPRVQGARPRRSSSTRSTRSTRPAASSS